MYHNQIRFQRYDDFILNPYQELDSILEFLDLTPEPIMDFYLASKIGKWRDGKNATNVQFQLPYTANANMTIRKNAEKSATFWMEKLSFDKIQDIEHKCEKALDALGYARYQNKTMKLEEIIKR